VKIYDPFIKNHLVRINSLIKFILCTWVEITLPIKVDSGGLYSFNSANWELVATIVRSAHALVAPT